jgi:competence protein ComEA
VSSPPPWRTVEVPPAPAADPAGGHGATGRPIPLAAVAAAAIAVVLAIGGVAVVVVGYAGGAVPSGDASPAALSGPVVEVAGAVTHPGVYALPAGARVADAIAAAGGFGPRVSAERVAAEIPLAAPLVDGARVVVPSRDDPTPSGGTEGGPGLIDLNRASSEELDTLPGIGPVTAGKIVDARKEKPFASVDELRSRGILGQKALDRIRDLVTVR